MITFVLAAYNEEDRIGKSLSQLSDYLKEHFEEWEIIVVDDGSDDGTSEVIAREGQRIGGEVRLLGYKENAGKGYAVRMGILQSRGEHVFFTDSDLPYDLEAVPRAMEAFRGGADVVIADRTQRGSSGGGSAGWLRAVSSAVFSMVVQVLVLRGFGDTQAGFKGFKGDVAWDLFRRVEVRRFAFDVELLHIAKTRGYKIHRIPVRLVHSGGSTVRMSKDAVEMMRELCAIRRRAGAGVYDETAPGERGRCG